MSPSPSSRSDTLYGDRTSATERTPSTTASVTDTQRSVTNNDSQDDDTSQDGDSSDPNRDHSSGPIPLNRRGLPIAAGLGMGVAALLGLGKGLSTSSTLVNTTSVPEAIQTIGRQPRPSFRLDAYRQARRRVHHLIAWVIDGVRDVWWIIPLGYHKHDDDSPLANERRQMLFEYIANHPGQTVYDMARETDIPRSTVRYHAGILSREGLFTHEKRYGRRRYFATTAEHTADGNTQEVKRSLVHARKNESRAAVLDAIHDHDGQATVTTLADDLDRTAQTISHHLNRLEEDNLITRTREGRATYISLTDHAHVLSETLE